MQALEKIDINNNWVTITLVILLGCIVVLKITDSTKLRGHVLVMLNKSFIEEKIEEETSFFTIFNSLLFLFSTAVFSLIAYVFLSEYSNSFIQGYTSYLFVLVVVLSYLVVKKILEFTLARLLKINKTINFYLTSKSSYLYAISFLLFVLLIIVEYSELKPMVLFYSTAFLLVFRLVFSIRNNKKLIFSQLFYFILYLCAFEIAPLFILFKLML